MTEHTHISAKETQEGCILPRVIFIRATMSGLLFPFLPFTLLKENPIVEVQRYIELSDIDTQNSAMMRSAWNKIFNNVSTDQIYFVGAWNSVPEASPRMLKAAGMTFVIASCGPHHTRWLTTRPMLWYGELVAWCFEIDMHSSHLKSVVTLSEANMIRLVPGVQLLERRVA